MIDIAYADSHDGVTHQTGGFMGDVNGAGERQKHPNRVKTHHYVSHSILILLYIIKKYILTRSSLINYGDLLSNTLEDDLGGVYFDSKYHVIRV